MEHICPHMWTMYVSDIIHIWNMSYIYICFICSSYMTHTSSYTDTVRFRYGSYKIHIWRGYVSNIVHIQTIHNTYMNAVFPALFIHEPYRIYKSTYNNNNMKRICNLTCFCNFRYLVIIDTQGIKTVIK